MQAMGISAKLIPMDHRCPESNKKVQMKGVSESEMLWKSFQGNDEAMQKAIDKGDIQVKHGKFYWTRDIHEHITGGKDSWKCGGGEPEHMSQQDMQRFMELLNFAPWQNGVPHQTMLPRQK